jgi:hypothetical protein
MKLDAGSDDIYEYHGMYPKIPLSCHFVAAKQSKSLLFLFKKKNYNYFKSIQCKLNFQIISLILKRIFLF